MLVKRHIDIVLQVDDVHSSKHDSSNICICTLVTM